MIAGEPGAGAGASDLLIDPSRTALLLVDFQHDVLERNLRASARTAFLDHVGRLLETARRRALLIGHVVVRFRAGYPEVSGRGLWRRDLALTGRLQEGSPGGEIVPPLAPHPGEVVVTKRRTSAFSTTDLAAVLRARDVDTIVLAGVSTGGSVLSTVRAAADLDYRIIVVSDCCSDPDEEVHRILCDRVFPRQATMATTREVLTALAPT